jgi:hypothetical protein
MVLAVDSQQDLVSLLTAFRSELMTLWNIFIAVSLGIVGLVYSEKLPARRELRIALSVAFLIFAAGNLYSLSAAQRFILALIAALSGDRSHSELFSRLHASPVWRLVVYHLGLDLAVLAAIWLGKSGRQAGAPRSNPIPGAA